MRHFQRHDQVLTSYIVLSFTQDGFKENIIGKCGETRGGHVTVPTGSDKDLVVAT